MPSPQQKHDGRGRPRKNSRDVLNGILWVLRTGAPWKDLPLRFPPHQTCHRWFQTWVRQGVFKQILTELGEDLYQRGGIDIRETFIDGSFSPAKKGVVLSTLQSVARAPRSWQSKTLLVFLSPLTYKALHPTK
ncbi:transposase [Desulfosarcina sp.]|uniref:transposase n=1 Tax=Desulfosarcina sp. TaxID=2027861 RepID=UPI0039B9B499